MLGRRGTRRPEHGLVPGTTNRTKLDWRRPATGIGTRPGPPVLMAHLTREHQIEASEATVRRARYDLGYRWKRPRFVLSRCDPSWRQAKGGSSGA